MAGTKKAEIHTLLQHKRFADAMRLCEPLCKKNGNDAEAWFLLGSIYGHTGEPEKAIKALRRSISLHGGIAMTHFNLGLVYLHQNQPGQAEKCFEDVLRLEPGQSEARQWLAQLLQKKGAHQAAIVHFRELLKQQPDRIELLFSLGNSLRATEQFDDAELAYRKVLEIDPRVAGVANNLGITLYEKGDLKGALSSYRHSLELDTGQTDAHINLAKCYRELRQPEQAIASLEQALAIDPGKSEIHWDLSLLLLQLGQFEKGWSEYEWRTKGDVLMLRDFPFRPWNSEDLHNKTILVTAEQGIGDEVMFASCFPDLITTAGQVVIDCEPRLAPLFTRSFPTSIIHAAKQTEGISWLSDIPKPDFHVRAGSLPRIFRNRPAAFPAHNGYLKADPQDIDLWKQRFSELGKKFVAGISWKGGHASQKGRRSTSLPDWGPILRNPDIAFVNLQYGDIQHDLDQANELFGITVHHWPDSDPLQNMDHFAAQIGALDLVISVDNSTVHLAGALGIKTRVLQPYTPDWRWMGQSERSYWYPEVRQFHPSGPGDWVSVIQQASVELGRLHAP